MGTLYWEFDRILFKPVKMRYMGVNPTDGWVRFKYLESTSHSGGFTSLPRRGEGNMFFKSRKDCLTYTIKRLLEQL